MSYKHQEDNGNRPSSWSPVTLPFPLSAGSANLSPRAVSFTPAASWDSTLSPTAAPFVPEAHHSGLSPTSACFTPASWPSSPSPTTAYFNSASWSNNVSPTAAYLIPQPENRFVRYSQSPGFRAAASQPYLGEDFLVAASRPPAQVHMPHGSLGQSRWSTPTKCLTPVETLESVSSKHPVWQNSNPSVPSPSAPPSEPSQIALEKRATSGPALPEPEFSSFNDSHSVDSNPLHSYAKAVVGKLALESLDKAVSKVANDPLHLSSKCHSDCCVSTPLHDRANQASGDTHYVPSPMITFLVDEVDHIVCQICCKSKICLDEKTSKIVDTQPVALPCGHVFGHRCLRKWMKVREVCPTCQMSLRHSGCEHKIEPRTLDFESILAVPKTIPEGGCVGEYCRNCQSERQHKAELTTSFHQLKREFMKARELCEKTGTEEARERMVVAKSAFEEFPQKTRGSRLDNMFAVW